MTPPGHLATTFKGKETARAGRYQLQKRTKEYDGGRSIKKHLKKETTVDSVVWTAQVTNERPKSDVGGRILQGIGSQYQRASSEKGIRTHKPRIED